MYSALDWTPPTNKSDKFTVEHPILDTDRYWRRFDVGRWGSCVQQHSAWWNQSSSICGYQPELLSVTIYNVNKIYILLFMSLMNVRFSCNKTLLLLLFVCCEVGEERRYSCVLLTGKTNTLEVQCWCLWSRTACVGHDPTTIGSWAISSSLTNPCGMYCSAWYENHDMAA